MKNKFNICIIILVIIIILIISGLKIFSNHKIPSEIDNWYGFTTLMIKENEALKNSKNYVNFYGNNNLWKRISLKFKSTNSNSEFKVDLHDINKLNPYFIIPNNVKSNQTYELKEILLYRHNIKYNEEPKKYVTTQGSDVYINVGENKYIFIK